MTVHCPVDWHESRGSVNSTDTFSVNWSDDQAALKRWGIDRRHPMSRRLRPTDSSEVQPSGNAGKSRQLSTADPEFNEGSIDMRRIRKTPGGTSHWTKLCLPLSLSGRFQHRQRNAQTEEDDPQESATEVLLLPAFRVRVQAGHLGRQYSRSGT